MQKVSEMAHARIGSWVRVKLRDGSEICGRVVQRGPGMSTRHTIHTLDNLLVPVDFPSDQMIKLMPKAQNTWDVSKMRAVELDALGIPVFDVQPDPVVIPPRGWVWYLGWLTFLVATTAGGAGVLYWMTNG